MIHNRLRTLPESHRDEHLPLASAGDRRGQPEELARQIKYLKVENQILRCRLPRQVLVTPKERARLVKFAGKLAAKVLGQLVTIVHPDTLLRWVREDRRGNRKQPPVWRGRPRTPEQLRRLIRKMARENDWGYTRIMGELKKLGIQPPSRNTVKNILKAVGLDPVRSAANPPGTTSCSGMRSRSGSATSSAAAC